MKEKILVGGITDEQFSKAGAVALVAFECRQHIDIRTKDTLMSFLGCFYNVLAVLEDKINEENKEEK